MRFANRLLYLFCPSICIAPLPNSFQIKVRQRTSRNFILFFGLVLIVLQSFSGRIAYGQTAGPNALRSDEAITFLQSSLHVIGAVDASVSNLSCSVTGELSNQSGGSAAREWSESLYTSLMPSPTSLQSGSKSDTIENQQLRIRNARLEAWLHHPNFALNRLLQDPSFALELHKLSDGRIQLVATETRAGKPIPPASQTWYFSPGDQLPIRVEYSLVNPKHNSFFLQRSIEYVGFKQFGEIKSPTQDIIRTGSSLSKERTITDMHCTPLT